ncbi:MAG TPA: HAD family hydrolase, partial [Candidatus Glassbacteria bacterium]|nr:HAD family hydrolase [Candidatus Glassbacteria bacterium]
GLSVTEAAMLGNWAASVTVTKLKQTGTATPAEIRSRMENSRLVFRPDLATDQRKARYLSGTRIEIVNPEIDRGRIRQVIFDHDGTVSTLRQGWEPIMEEVMLEQIFGTTYATVPAAEFFRVKRRVAEFIDQSTGIQTIIQMQGLADLVAELGYVSKDKILDPVGYKAIYNEKLLEMVNERIARLDAGELAEEDFILKGTLAFMKAFKKRTGATFYLASGTDQQDVEIEAGRLGYAALFDGGIYGAKGDIEKFSKKKLMAQIIRDHGLEGPELCTFGDGPVEISECKRNRGIAVGVASDELRRWGLNPAKRERLVKAGADVIVADFTQWEMLLDWLMGK